MVQISREIIENLKPFEDIINYSRTHEFANEDSSSRCSIEAKLEWSDFNIKNLEELVLWLDKVETLARWENLTKKTTIRLIRNFLEKKNKNIHFFTVPDLEIHTMLDIKIYVIKKLFKPSVVYSTLSDLLSGPYNAETIENILTTFSNKCRAFVMAVLSFGVSFCVNKVVLMSSLLSRIPKEIRMGILEEEGFPLEWNLNKMYDYILQKEKLLVILQEIRLLENATTLASSASEAERSTMLGSLNESICYCCGEAGHMKYMCRFKYTRCELCKRVGHRVNTCRCNR